jgi:hypothetical protein
MAAKGFGEGRTCGAVSAKPFALEWDTSGFQARARNLNFADNTEGGVRTVASMWPVTLARGLALCLMRWQIWNPTPCGSPALQERWPNVYQPDALFAPNHRTA